MAMASQAIACGGSVGSSISSSPSSELSSEFLGGKGKIGRVSLSGNEQRSSRGVGGLRIEAAISRQKKEATVEKARQQLEGAYLVAGIKYGGLTVKQFQTLRKALPESATLIVAKNTLIGKAIEGTKWEALKPALKGMNAWLFVHTEEIPMALKPYRDMQKELKLEDNDFTGGVFEGKFYLPEEFKQLESMPTRAEIYSKLLSNLQAPASNVVATLQAPSRDLVLTLKAHIAQLEEQEGWYVVSEIHEFEAQMKPNSNFMQYQISLQLNVAACLQKLNDHVKAIELCNKVLEGNPHHVKALFRRGTSYTACSDFELARNDFNQEAKEKERKQFKGLFEKKPGALSDVVEKESEGPQEDKQSVEGTQKIEEHENGSEKDDEVRKGLLNKTVDDRKESRYSKLRTAGRDLMRRMTRGRCTIM